MASEEDYTIALINAVKKRPLLYNVALPDYKNKNKKGEAFKEVQQEMRQAGCSEFQVQGTYKKWISLKRKFRVEFFKSKSEDGVNISQDGEHDANGSCPFKFYYDLMFLIPYCEFYKSSKMTGKRKFSYSHQVPLEEDESDDERCDPFNDDLNHNSSTLDQLINQKRVKLEQDMGNSVAGQHNSSSSGSNRSPSPQFQTGSLYLNNHSNKTLKNQSSALDPLSLLSQQQIESFQQKCQQVDDVGCLSSDSAKSFTGKVESPNMLFGQLVAAELDKLPESMHNLVRAQLLLILAQAESSSSANPFNTPDKSFANFNNLMSM
ncbi:alcohol dehydrogenase transcription factor myb/SANT-like domain-containing protein [Ditylenchus destructor]|uniref:Alcohol dehydrogenase transcription factor myb/SANT-like domain-containing protein n=1 Tax=Ditylenchus destructor TaxID=166010 RepID=A0AAD4N8Q4_9BILA|nr:alcohol dehydrogenase transcription factor myb/SANT-like domain-containing protein [Ditylenchus destructor]